MQPLYDFYVLYAFEITLLLALVVAILLIWLIILHVRLTVQNRRFRAAIRGMGGTDFETALRALNRTVNDHRSRLATLEQRYEGTAKAVAQHAGNVGVVRFNPFNDTGSDQSFTIAWVDSQMNGVVLSSLYNRTGNRIYAKPLVGGESAYTLTDEERQAISKAAGQEQVQELGK